MKSDAIAISNYFVDKANEENYDLTLLRLVKYVYIAYGFALALLDRSIINNRFDKVEAWKYGPVIPSVYHSFKHNQNNPIKEKSYVLSKEDPNGELAFSTPTVKDERVVMILDFVWDRYKDKSIHDLIELLHKEGTPWKFCYKEGFNVEIPDGLTKLYYQSIVKNASK